MKILNSVLYVVVLLAILTIIKSEDQGDWVDPYNLPIESEVHPFYAGYLNVSYGKQYYYVYHPS